MNNRLFKCVMVLCLFMMGMAADAQEQQIQMSSLVRGDEAPDFLAKDTLGVEHRLRSLRGMWVIVDFWASWCGDCRRDMPELKGVFADFGGCEACADSTRAPRCACRQQDADRDAAGCTCASAGMAFVGVSMDHDASAWKNYLRKEQPGWLQVANLVAWKDNPIAKAYDLHWIPTYFIIDPLGRVHDSVVSAQELREELREIREILKTQVQ